MRTLIRIDDKKLRQQAFASAQTLLKKLDRLERQIETFERRDQRQFHDWHELMFRERRQRVERVRDEYRKLCELYNAMIALSRQENLALPDALVFLRSEEERYRSGSAEVRRDIEEKRLAREEFARLEAEDEMREAQRREEKQKRKAEKTEASEKQERDEELAAIMAMDDEEVLQWCKSPEIVGAWLWLGIWAARENGDARAFFRVWSLTDNKLQKLFTRRFESEYGIPLKEVMDKMRGLQDSDPKRPDPQPANPGGDFAGPGSVTALSPELRAETIKLVYRQLVRKLHPDLQAHEGAQSVWQKKIWFRVQQSYRERDLEGLDKLLRLVLLRSGELNALRLSEIVASRQWLESELGQTERGIRDLRRSPAWGFSTRKDYAPVVRKVEKQLEAERLAVESSLFELQGELRRLERSK